MSQQVIVLKDVTVVKFIVISGFKVQFYHRIRVQAQVNGQDVKGHIIVVHLVIAESNVDVDCMEVFVLYQKFLVDFCRFFKVTP
jgi:hypothetical protein